MNREDRDDERRRLAEYAFAMAQADTSPSALIEREELEKSIDDALATLTPREESVLRMRFGFDGEPMTLREIGQRTNRADGGEGSGVTVERVRQIDLKAQRKMRHPARSDALLLAVGA